MRAEAVAAEYGARAYSDVDALLAHERIDAASVAVPTNAHLAVGRRLLEADIDVLVEKPLAVDLPEADALIELACRHGRVAQAGHLERFNPAVRAVLPHVTRPMFFEVHRLSVFTPRSLDVDVVMDLMIHDLDVVLSLVDSPVRDLRAVGLPVLTPKVDIANVRVEFESGCVANFTASRVSTERVRKLRFFQPQQYISLDYSRRDAFMLTVKPAGASHAPTQDAALPGTAGGRFALPEIVPSKPEVVSEEPLRAELRSFLEAVASRSRPVVSSGRRQAGVAVGAAGSILYGRAQPPRGSAGANELAVEPVLPTSVQDARLFSRDQCARQCWLVQMYPDEYPKRRALPNRSVQPVLGDKTSLLGGLCSEKWPGK